MELYNLLKTTTKWNAHTYRNAQIFNIDLNIKYNQKEKE